jgi:hypothetical protein
MDTAGTLTNPLRETYELPARLPFHLTGGVADQEVRCNRGKLKAVPLMKAK